MRSILIAFLLCCSAAIHAWQNLFQLIVGASVGGDPQGVLRLVNSGDSVATVCIHTIDGTGMRTEPATLTLPTLAAVDLSAVELQAGSAANRCVRRA